MPLFLLLVLMAAGAVFPTSLEARPRDDVMSATNRCSDIADTRKWLDCYYGAAQPIRASLGLPPALANQVALGSAPRDKGPINDSALRDSVLDNAYRCFALTKDRDWLNCYYSSARPARLSLGLQTSPQSGEVNAFPRDENSSGPVLVPYSNNAANQEISGYGLARPDSNKTISRVVSRLSTYTFDREKNFVVTLANGQVWRQVAGDTDNAHWNKPAAEYMAVITHGILGGFDMKIQGSPKLFKVKRIR